MIQMVILVSSHTGITVQIQTLLTNVAETLSHSKFNILYDEYTVQLKKKKKKDKDELENFEISRHMKKNWQAMFLQTVQFLY